MARARNIKPGFFENELLAEMPIAARLLFIGLWTLADREGRLEDRPRRIRLKLMPLDDVDVDALLQRLHDDGMILRYTGPDGVQYIQILNFTKHQSPHCKEKASTIPAPDMPGASTRQAEERKCDAPPDSLILRLSDSPNPEDKTPNGVFPATKVASVEIPMQSGTHQVTTEDLTRYRQLYPGVDLEQEFRNMVGWLEANPEKRSKGTKGAKQRIANWLSRATKQAPKQTSISGDDRFRGAV